MLSLNDAAEASYATKLIVDTLTAHHPEIPREAFETQLNYLFSLYTPFITCFCEDGDLLSQWRGYSDQGEGFAIGFSTAWLLSLGAKWRLIKVIYDRTQQVDLILMALQLALAEANKHGCSEDEQRSFWPLVAAQMTPWVVMFKDPAFREEQEWRIVNIDVHPPPFNFRRSGQRIVPFVALPLNDSVTSVIRGPYFAGSDTRGIDFALRSNGIMKIVQESKIPLRG